MAEPVVFTFMRHGPTDWNADKRVQGQSDTRLNSHGREMALEWGEALGRRQDEAPSSGEFTRILSSDLNRAVETAQLVNRFLNLPLDLDQDLQEQDWGRWTGGRIRDLRRSEQGEVERQEERGWSFRPPDGEGRTAVLARALGALERSAARHRGGRILVVTHQGVLKCLFYRLLNLQFLPHEGDPLERNTLHTLSLDPAAMARPGAESGAGLALIRLNEAF